MDAWSLRAILVVAIPLSLALAGWLFVWRRESKRLQEAREWPAVEATIEFGGFESTRQSGKVVLPTFTFSYRVGGHYHAGRFCLIPQSYILPAAFPDGLIPGWIGRKLMVRYDPEHPDVSFVPEDSIDGYRIGQRIGVHAIMGYYPRDAKASSLTLLN